MEAPRADAAVWRSLENGGGLAKSLSGSAGFYRRQAYLTDRRQPVRLVGSATRSADPRRPGPEHVNWLERNAFRLPLALFGQRAVDGSIDLIDALDEALGTVAHDGLWVTKPIGSVAYARAGGDIAWDLVRDIDVWCYVSAATMASAPLYDLTRDVLDALHDQLEERGIRCRMTRRGNLLLLEDRRTPRLMEVKVADVAWLTEGLQHLEDRDMHVREPRKPPYVKQVRKEWAVFVDHENYFGSPPGEAALREQLGAMSELDRLRSSEYAYRDNLAVGMRQLKPERVAHATFHQYRFARYAMKVLKVAMVLSVIRRDHVTHRHVVQELRRFRAREIPWKGPRQRISYMSELMEMLERFRSVDTTTFSVAATEEFAGQVLGR